MSIIISADSHILEPPTLWLERLPKEFRDRAPRVVKHGCEEAALLVAEGIKPHHVSGFSAASIDRDNLADFDGTGFWKLRRGGWDIEERLEDQDADGIQFEILYPSLTMPLFALHDEKLKAACFHAYNEWLHEFVMQAPQHLAGVGLIAACGDPRTAVTEIQQCANQGFVGVMFGVTPRAKSWYSHPQMDNIWAALVETGLPLILHSLTCQDGGNKVSRTAVQRYIGLNQDIQFTLTDLACGGVLERFSKLRLLSAENDAGWLPYFYQRLDKGFENFRSFDSLNLKELPSHSIRRALWLTFQDDAYAIQQSSSIGIDRIMWGSDYPHLDSTFPKSKEVLAKLLEHQSLITREQIMSMNAISFFRLDRFIQLQDWYPPNANP